MADYTEVAPAGHCKRSMAVDVVPGGPWPGATLDIGGWVLEPFPEARFGLFWASGGVATQPVALFFRGLWK